jgi:hypothetical protein
MSSGALPSVGAVPRHDSDNASDLSLGCLSTQAGQRRCDRGRPHVARGGVKVVSKTPDAITRRASCGIGFMLFLQELLDTGGRARTDTVLSHHRILSPRCYILNSSTMSANSACISRKYILNSACCPDLYSPVLSLLLPHCCHN